MMVATLGRRSLPRVGTKEELVVHFVIWLLLLKGYGSKQQALCHVCVF